MVKPTVEELRAVLRHECGRLYWLVGRRAGFEAGCARKDGRVVVRVGGRGGPLLLRSRVVWALVNGEWPDGEIDHIDCNSANDDPKNLRVATSSEQKRNTRVRKNNSAGVKGVHWHKRLGKWAAQIVIGGRRTHLGVFDAMADAQQAYSRANAEVAGEFARDG